MANELTIVERVNQKVKQLKDKQELHFPANYSPDNALKSAWLILQETVDRNGKSVLTTCTKDSIANALLDMVVQGLNPAKKQGYFIAYGPKLVFQRSYFGTMAVTKQVTGARDIYAQVVFKGDEFEYQIKGSKKVITKHVQKLENINESNIIAAYCVIEFQDGTEFSDLMTIEQIKKSWEKSKMNPSGEKSTHSQFAEEMAKRTVINRTCKKYINSSDDSSLILDTFRKNDEEAAEYEIEAEISENANTEVIDIEATEAEQKEMFPEGEPDF